MIRARVAFFAIPLVALASACGGSTSAATHALDAIDVPKTLTVTSPAFTNGGPIPRVNTCDGTGTAPTIRWSGLPSDTKSVVVVVDDPDAASTPDHDFLQWLVIQLPATSGRVPSTAPNVSELDNTGGTHGWSPPCPPVGSTHHYQFTVYALRDYVCADNGDTASTADCAAPSSAQALPQIRDAAVAKGVLVGVYSR